MTSSHRHNRLQLAIARIVLQVIAEVLLGLLGLDDLADMGEWVLERRVGGVGAQVQYVISV